MVLQVPADARQLVPDLDPMLLEVPGRADPRQHQEVRRADRPCRQDHLAAHAHPLGRPAFEEGDTRAAAAAQLQAGDMRPRDHG